MRAGASWERTHWKETPEATSDAAPVRSNGEFRLRTVGPYAPLRLHLACHGPQSTASDSGQV